jgi:hypothetical protein
VEEGKEEELEKRLQWQEITKVLKCECSVGAEDDHTGKKLSH